MIGNTAMHFAFKGNNLNIVKELMGRNVDLALRNKKNMTP